MELDELKAGLLASRAAGGRQYPVALRQAAMAYVAQARSEGASVSAMASALGVKASTVSWWVTRSRAPRARLRQVSVASDAGVVGVGALTLELPNGARVSGLDVAGAAALLRALS